MTKVRNRIIIVLIAFLTNGANAQQIVDPVIDNGTISLKLDLSRGGAISYLSLSGSTRNIVNIADEGRYIQQSYYAGNRLDRKAEGQSASWSPWNWNPIQVGDAYRNRANILDFQKTGDTLYVKCVPMLWDMNNMPAEAEMEQWTILSGNVITVRNRISCHRTDSIYKEGILNDQELPAVYPVSALKNLYSYFGDKPFENDVLSKPATVNLSSGFWGRYENNMVTENWMAYVDDSNWGIGVYNPVCTNFLAGMYLEPGGEASSNSTSYIAPLKKEILNKYSVYEYEYYLIVGKIDEIRSKIYQIHSSSIVASQSKNARNYYVDCSSNLDGNGSLKNPWNTLTSVNNFTFNPGDSILFKRGTKALGELWPKGSGNEKAQIVIDAYGTGSKPIIDAQGKENSAAIRLNNQEYWTILNMEVINNATTMGSRWGIYVFSNDSLVKHRIHIKNNTVHDVYASCIRDPKGSNTPSFYKVGGIYVKVVEPGKMDDVLIEGNQLTDILGIGISFWGESENTGGGMNWNNLGTNVIIRRNSVVRTGADGILILGTDNELIEYNFVDGAGQLGVVGDMPGKPGNNGTDYIAGLWPTRHRDGIIQYNEVCNTRRFIGDGQAFDNDMFVSGTTIFQYNYSHDNEGGFFLDCCSPEETNTGNIIRYNISQNDGRYDYMTLSKGKNLVYNNIFYTIDTIAINNSSNNTFYNNIFWGKYGKWNDNLFDHNSYFGGLAAPANDSNKIAEDPGFVCPGSGRKGFETLEGYKLLLASPCLSGGKIISDNVRKDFWGNTVPVSTAPVIGVFNGDGKEMDAE